MGDQTMIATPAASFRQQACADCRVYQIKPRRHQPTRQYAEQNQPAGNGLHLPHDIGRGAVGFDGQPGGFPCLQTAFENIAFAPSAEFRQHRFRHCRAFAAQTIKNHAGRGVVGQFASMLLRRQGQCAADMPAPIFRPAADVRRQRAFADFGCRFGRGD